MEKYRKKTPALHVVHNNPVKTAQIFSLPSPWLQGHMSCVLSYVSLKATEHQLPEKGVNTWYSLQGWYRHGTRKISCTSHTETPAFSPAATGRSVRLKRGHTLPPAKPNLGASWCLRRPPLPASAGERREARQRSLPGLTPADASAPAGLPHIAGRGRGKTAPSRRERGRCTAWGPPSGRRSNIRIGPSPSGGVTWGAEPPALDRRSPSAACHGRPPAGR